MPEATVFISDVNEYLQSILQAAESKPWDGRHEHIKRLTRESIRALNLKAENVKPRPWWWFWS